MIFFYYKPTKFLPLYLYKNLGINYKLLMQYVA